MANDHSLGFKFSTEIFDYKGPIPEDANAGNQYYGHDVAQYLYKHLQDPRLNLKVVDEDWGWLVFGDVKPNHSLMLAIYNEDISEDPTLRKGTNAWNLLVRQFRNKKILGLIPSKTQVPCEDWLVEKLKTILSTNGIKLLGIDKEF
jgi:hypothetical protein